MLRETVEIVTSMWTRAGDDVQGRATTSCRRANCDPKPLQDPHPPVWIGGGGEQLTLRVVARHADCSNFGGQPEQWAHKRDVLRAHCADVGRDPDEIRMTWSPRGVHPRRPRPRSLAAGTPQPVGRAGRDAGGPATSSARPSRSPRRCSRTSTSAAAASSRGAPTTPTPRPWSCFATEVMPAFRCRAPAQVHHGCGVRGGRARVHDVAGHPLDGGVGEAVGPVGAADGDDGAGAADAVVARRGRRGRGAAISRVDAEPLGVELELVARRPGRAAAASCARRTAWPGRSRRRRSRPARSGRPSTMRQLAAVALVADDAGGGAELVAPPQPGALEQPVVRPVHLVAAGAVRDADAMRW